MSITICGITISVGRCTLARVVGVPIALEYTRLTAGRYYTVSIGPFSFFVCWFGERLRRSA